MRIAVVCGGPSVECEVSRVSGREVFSALTKSFEDVHLVELDSDIDRALRRLAPDVVFPALHGPPGEDGTFQGMLEMMGIPYVGSGVKASAIAMDKIVAKQVFRAGGLPVAQDVVVMRAEGLAASVDRARRSLGETVVIKPSSQGSALGVMFAHDEDSLRTGIESAFTFDSRVLVEEKITGKEVTVGILERNGLEAFPAIEIRTPEDTWYDYEHRYTPGQSEHIIPARLSDAQYARTMEVAKQAFLALGCRDLGRVDFVVPETGEPVVLEINTLPGMTPTSLYPDGACANGLSFVELMAYLVSRASSRLDM